MVEVIRRWRLPAGWLTPGELVTGLALLALLAPALWWASPWILPVRILEGPLVQNAQPGEFRLVWYTTRPVDCRVRIVSGAGARVITAERQSRRHEATIDGLEAGQAYAYSIFAGDKPIPDATGVARTLGSIGNMKFAVFGDSGRGHVAQYRLAARIELFDPDFIVHTGDLVYGRGERENFKDRFFAPYRRLLRAAPFWPSLGNHDVRESNGDAYREVFSLPRNGPPSLEPENNYWFDAGIARFAIFDSNLNEAVLTEVVAPWLREVMSDPAPTWKFVVCHHPPYTSGNYAPDERLRRSICRVLEECGVDILFTGHDHIYQRSHPLLAGKRVDVGGVVYIVSGSGGAKLYKLAPQSPDFSAVRNAAIHSFTQITIRGERLHGQQVGVDGSTIDDFTIDKSLAPSASQVAPPE